MVKEMLHSYNDLTTFAIRATDEPTGEAADFYFDDQNWKLRYLVTHTGFPLFGHQGLVGAQLLGTPDTEKREIPVALSREEVENAPPPEADAPVSERKRAGAHAAEDTLWPPFLIGTGVPYSPTLAMEQLDAVRPEPAASEADLPPGNPHLRSMDEVSGYRVSATDGEFGSVTDYLVDPDGWQLRYLVIDTGNWLPGRRVVIATDWVQRIDDADRQLLVNVDKTTIENAPGLRDIADLKFSDAHEASERYGTIGLWPV